MRGALFAMAIVFLALGAGLPKALQVSMVSPVYAEIANGTVVEIGNVGPGQTFSVAVTPQVPVGGAYGKGGSYDQLFASSLPPGWESTPSKLYANPLQADITVPKDAKDGNYRVAMRLWDEAGSAGLGGDLEFYLVVNVTSKIMDMSVSPLKIRAGAGQPAVYYITITNKGMANDIFTIGSSGVRTWEFRRNVYVPSQTSKTIKYELVGEEETRYKVKIWARSSSSDKIYAEKSVELEVKTDLLSDIKAINKGVLLFPSTEAPLYFALGLISNLFS